MAATTIYAPQAAKYTTTGTVASVLLPSERARHKIVQDAKTIPTTQLDDVGDVTIFCSIPSCAIIRSIKIFNADLDSNGTPLLTYRLGLYYLNGNGIANTVGTELTTANALVSTAQTTLQAANTAGVELVYINRTLATDYQKRAWELGGLTADCGGFLGIGLKIAAVAATAVAGDVLIRVEYVEE